MIFVTGGTGLLGRHLLVVLAQEHSKITAIYRNKSKIEKVKRCFSYYLKEEDAQRYFKRIFWEKCSILDIPKLKSLMENHKSVYHCAGLVSFAKRDYDQLIEINRHGTANIVNIALDLNIEKLCFVSSTAAVGNKNIPEAEEVTEDGKWIKSEYTSGYAISKYSAEKEVWRGISEGLNAIIVNPSIIIGAGSWEESSLTIFKTLSKGLKFYPPGANSYVDARDVAQIMFLLMKKNSFNERFLCVGSNVKFKTLFTKIAERLDLPAPHKKATSWKMKLAQLFLAIQSYITFSRPPITKFIRQKSMATIRYSNQKVKRTLGYTFLSLEESIDNAINGRYRD